jgi:CAAX protease family protein
VLLLVFAPIVPRSLAAIFSPQSLFNRNAPITNRSLLWTAGYELILLVLLALLLRTRGWSLARLTAQPAWRDLALGCALSVGAYLGSTLLWLLVVGLWPDIGRIAATIAGALVGADLRWPSVLLVSLVNPVFEEALICAYPIAALRERIGVTAAVNVSAALRVFAHFYQGALGIFGIVPMALLFAYAYARTGRLWPLILAHAILDLAALAAHVG